uniref:C2H2-type domain-containing protein n=1 Tax=Oncorhynchus mykiss TaxID=8022 RepID=A0A8L0DRV8_ONCMY
MPYTWSVVVRLVGRIAKFSKMTLEAANGSDVNIQFSGHSSGGHSCSQCTCVMIMIFNQLLDIEINILCVWRILVPSHERWYQHFTYCVYIFVQCTSMCFLLAELDSDMPSQVFSCPQCPFSHRREVNLQQHIRKEHLTEEDSRNLDSGGAENSLPSSQTIQRPSIKTTKKYICFKCGKGFRSPSDLKRHKGVHTDMQPFHCNQCDKRFKAKGSLKQHQRVHSGERPYDCSHCGRGFRTSDILKSHIRIHTGERPYGCTMCGKRFIQRQVLTRHIRMHSGEKPYLCSICGKTFASSKLKVHQRSHTGERPYPCTQCPKGFSTSTRLVKHMRIHTGEKPYPCVKCGKRFSERGNMRIHQRMHEKERKGRQMY